MSICLRQIQRTPPCTMAGTARLLTLQRRKRIMQRDSRTRHTLLLPLRSLACCNVAPRTCMCGL